MHLLSVAEVRLTGVDLDTAALLHAVTIGYEPVRAFLWMEAAVSADDGFVLVSIHEALVDPEGRVRLQQHQRLLGQQTTHRLQVLEESILEGQIIKYIFFVVDEEPTDDFSLVWLLGLVDEVSFVDQFLAG